MRLMLPKMRFSLTASSLPAHVSEQFRSISKMISNHLIIIIQNSCTGPSPSKKKSSFFISLNHGIIINLTKYVSIKTNLIIHINEMPLCKKMISI